MPATCNVCQSTNVKKTKRFRMGRPVAIVALILFTLPGLVFSAIGVMGLAAAKSAHTSTTTDSDKQIASQLTAAGIDSSIAKAVAEGRRLTAEQKASLTPAQQRQVDDATMTTSAAHLGAGIGAGLVGGIGFGGLMGGLFLLLIGMLLRMRKKVLQCGECQAVLAEV